MCTTRNSSSATHPKSSLSRIVSLSVALSLSYDSQLTNALLICIITQDNAPLPTSLAPMPAEKVDLLPAGSVADHTALITAPDLGFSKRRFTRAAYCAALCCRAARRFLCTAVRCSDDCVIVVVMRSPLLSTGVASSVA